jgi:hypothetical protein
MQNAMREDVQQYASENKLRIEPFERDRLLFVKIPTFPATVRSEFFLPFDSELKNSVIINIRACIGGASAPAAQVPPFGLDGVIQTADPGNYVQWVFNMKNKDGHFQWSNVPMYSFLVTSTINQKDGWDCTVEFIPEESFFTFFDVGNVKSNFYFPLVFSFHKIISR